MKLTLLLIAVMAAVFAYELSLPDAEPFFGAYGFSGANMLAHPYVLVTSIFVHANLTHLLSNIFAMLFFSAAVESELGGRRTLLLFLAGGIAGDLFSLLFYPFDSISVGASAGVFALVGAGILVRPVDLSLYPFVVPVPLALLGMLYIIYNIYGLLFDITSNISYAGHFGGMTVGLLAGVKRQGLAKSMKIIILSLLVLLAIPVVFYLVRNALFK